MTIVMLPPYAMLAGSTVAAMGGGPADVTAPVLTSPFGLPLGDTSAFQGVTTNEATGTLYFVLTTSATPPSAAQVKAGQDHTGAAAAYAFGQAVSSTGIKSNTATGLTSNTAYYGYLMHEDAAANQSSVAASGILTTLTTGTSDTDFDNLIAAASVAPTNLRKGYVARFIQALYAASVWSKIDVMWVLAAHDEQFGRLNWKSPGSFTLTAINSPTFTTDRGFAGNGSTSELDSGWDWGTNGVQYTQNNAHAFVYQRTSGQGVPALNQNNASYRTSIAGRQTTNLGINTATRTTGVNPNSTPSSGMVRRNNSTEQSLLFDGVEIMAPTAAPSTTGTSTTDFRMGSAFLFQNAQIAGASLGAYLDNTEALAFYTAWHAYMVALGADT